MTTMIEHKITHDKNFGHSELFLDFLGNQRKLAKYIIGSGPKEVADKIGKSKIDREKLCDILTGQNKDFNSKALAFENIERLRGEDALCIFSGQQAGILGGPLLTLYKAVDIVKRAVFLEKELKRPVIPIFWIACDDHDFQEINHTYSIDRAGELVNITYNSSEDALVPVADLCFTEGDDYNEFRQQVIESFGGRDFEEEHLKRLFEAYGENSNIVQAFATMLNDFLPDLGLVIFCPHNVEIKTMSKSFFKEIVERHFSVKERLDETAKSLEDDGYHIQAVKKESAVHLFYHGPIRTPIHYIDDNYVVGDKKLGLSGMLDMIDKYPEKFSPDVLTRPVWQSFLFPVTAQTGGPSEIAYFCQIGKLFELFNVSQPYYYSRVNATIVERRQEEMLEKYKIEFEELAGDIEQLFNRVSAQSFPAEIEDKIRDYREKFESDYFAFTNGLIEYEKSLDPVVKQTYGKIDFALTNLEKKIFSQHKKQMSIVRQQMYRLQTALYPNRTFQERILNINYFISKYGFGVVDYIVSKLDVNVSDHQLIFLSDYNI